MGVPKRSKSEAVAQDCIFCKLVRGQIASVKLYEDKAVLAFLDISPVNKGHTLVIPKKHYEVITEIPADEFKRLLGEVQKIAAAVVSATKAEGFNIVNNNRKAGNQVVPHVHFHIIPRYHDDAFGHRWPSVKYDDNEIQQYRDKISRELT